MSRRASGHVRRVVLTSGVPDAERGCERRCLRLGQLLRRAGRKLASFVTAHALDLEAAHAMSSRLDTPETAPGRYSFLGDVQERSSAVAPTRPSSHSMPSPWAVVHGESGGTTAPSGNRDFDVGTGRSGAHSVCVRGRTGERGSGSENAERSVNRRHPANVSYRRAKTRVSTGCAYSTIPRRARNPPSSAAETAWLHPARRGSFLRPPHSR